LPVRFYAMDVPNRHRHLERGCVGTRPDSLLHRLPSPRSGTKRAEERGGSRRPRRVARPVWLGVARPATVWLRPRSPGGAGSSTPKGRAGRTKPDATRRASRPTKRRGEGFNVYF